MSNMEKVNIVPGFILKLWKMINDPQCDDLISWSNNGQSFIIIDPAKFSQELSKYFKHNNLSSFIRQLNMYGFRKVTAIENSGLHPGSDDLHFTHPDFQRDQPERLESIKRKLPQKLVGGVDLRNVIKGISEIEDKQKDVTKTLTDIKRENEMLWAELHDLRQKHQQQQLYISRLMKLVFEAMEQNGIKTNMLQVKHTPPLMIEASDGSADQVDPNTLYQSTSTVPNTIEQLQSSGTLPTTIEQLPTVIEQLPSTLEQVSTQLVTDQAFTSCATTNLEPHYTRVLEDTINGNQDQIDTFTPSIIDSFSEENMDELFAN